MKSRISCCNGDRPHTVHFTDGRAVSDGCDLSDDLVLATANMIRLGGSTKPSSCIALAALVLYGLDDTVACGATNLSHMGPWLDVYVRWQDIAAVKKKVELIVKSSPAHQARKAATKVLRRAPCFKGTLEVDFNSSIEFHLDVEGPLAPHLEGSVASFVTIPLQKHWMERVFKDPSCKELHARGILVLGKTESNEKVCLSLGKKGVPEIEVVP
jgi:hypothetical protein